MNTYVNALIESLEKKLEVLGEIRRLDEVQLGLIKEEPFSFDKFDKSTEEKGVLIFRLNNLDSGFEKIYARVKQELDENKPAYAAEIKKMQALIADITDQSVAVQAEEARNKAALEQVLKGERDKLKAQRSGIKAVNSYSQAMNYKTYN